MRILTSIWMVIIMAAVLLGVRIDNGDTIKTLRYKTGTIFNKYIQKCYDSHCGPHH